jgi:outer membrane protein OmpA-like peptidoglycan-associated protein
MNLKTGKKTLALGIGLALVLIFQGCATKNYVDEQMSPLSKDIQNLQQQVGRLDGELKGLDEKTSKTDNRVDGLDNRLDQTNAKVSSLSNRVDRLWLDRQVLGDLKEGVNFQVGSSNLSVGARMNIDAFLSRFADMADVRYIVVGYADKTGAARLNFDLGIRRAISAAKYMITNKGIDATRVNIRSEGTAGSLGKGDAMDRRVEIIAFKEVISSKKR